MQLKTAFIVTLITVLLYSLPSRCQAGHDWAESYFQFNAGFNTPAIYDLSSSFIPQNSFSLKGLTFSLPDNIDWKQFQPGFRNDVLPLLSHDVEFFRRGVFLFNYHRDNYINTIKYSDSSIEDQKKLLLKQLERKRSAK